MISGSVWMMPASGSASIAAARPHDGRARHQAVGVEHDHMRVGAAPARRRNRRYCRPCGSCSSRAADKRRARQARQAAAAPPMKARSSAIQISGLVVSERKNQSKLSPESRRLDILENRLQGGEDPARRLVVDRHDHGGPGREPTWRDGRRASTQEHRRADDAARKRQRDPREVQHEQAQQRPFQGRDAADVDDLIHLEAAVDGQRRPAAKGDEPRQPRRDRESRRRETATLPRIRI